MTTKAHRRTLSCRPQTQTGPGFVSTTKPAVQRPSGQAERSAAAVTAARIVSEELISVAELEQALGLKRQAVNIAVRACWIFAIVVPPGKNYYPAFYVDPTLDRQSVEHVSAALGSLPRP